MEMMLWNIVLTAFVAILGFIMKGKFEELKAVTVLLNKTREEVARDHVTRAEMDKTLDRLADRIDASIHRLEGKLDEMAKRG